MVNSGVVAVARQTTGTQRTQDGRQRTSERCKTFVKVIMAEIPETDRFFIAHDESSRLIFAAIPAQSPQRGEPLG